MADSYDSQFLDDPEFQSLLVGCLESLQRGETIDRDALVKDFPKYAEEIGQFLNDRQLLEQAASEFADVQPSRVAISAYAHTMDSGSSPKDFKAGESVRYIGEYEILKEIARGGMGVVFKARQQKLNRIVALKMILAGRLADTSDVERFHREARAAGRLIHPNIVPVHEIGEQDGRHYFTMDFVEGRSLAEHIRDETLPPRAAAELVRSTARAVQYAHDQGTVHRDLKPGNVLLDPTGEPKVTDFGLAKMLGGVDDETRAELTASGQVLGTPSYMSPEQASGKQELVGPASDIYSLGAILYVCLTGRAPFVADSPVDTLLQVLKKEPISPRELNPSVPKDLETICLKCLTKEPHKRYGTAAELADDLGRFLEGRPVSARPVGPLAKSARWCRRNPLVASLLTLVFLSMAAGTGISGFYANVANQHADNEEAQRQRAEESRDEAERERDAADRARRLAEQRGAELRRQLYVAHIPRALEAWNNGNTASVKQLLARHIPEGDEDDLRGFEWYWLDNLTKSARLTIETGRKIIAADISPDGESIATLGDRRLLIHRLDDGKEIHEFAVPYSGRGGVQFDSTGKFVAVGHDMVQLWNVQEGSLVWRGEPVDHTVWVGITPNDQRVLSIHVTEGKTKVARIVIREFDTGVLVREISVPNRIYVAAISPLGDHIAAACGDNIIRIWDLRSGASVREWASSGAVFGLSYSPDGRWLTAATLDGMLSRHDPVAGKLVERWQKQSNSFRCIDTDNSGRNFAAAGASQIAYLYDFKTGEPVREFRGHGAEIESISFRPGLQELVTCDHDGIIHVWDTRTEQGLLRLQGELIDLSDAGFSSDMKWFARSDGITWRKEQKGSVRLYQLADGSAGPILDGHESGVFGVAIAEGKAYSAGHDGKLITWDLETAKAVRTRSFDKPLTCFAASASGETLAVGMPEGEVQILETEPEKAVASFTVGPPAWEIDYVAVSSDGRFVAGRTRGGLAVWDCAHSQIVLQVQNIKAGPVQFSHSGERLAAALDGKVRIYSTSTWEVLHELQAHSQAIGGIAFHPNDQRLATRSTDAMIKLWETETWQNVLTLPFSYRIKNDRFAPIFSPDGNYLVAGRQGSEAHLLTATTIAREQRPDAEFLEARAKTLAHQQLWDEALKEYERVIELDSADLPWAYVHAAEVAALIEQTDQTRTRIIKSAKRAEDYEESNLYLASRLIQVAQLRPGTDPNPERSLRIANRAWQELEKPTGVSLLYTLFRQGRDKEVVEFRSQHDGIGSSWTTNQLLHAGALYRLGQVHEASEILNRAADRYARDLPTLGRGRFIDREGISGIIWDLLSWQEVSAIALTALNQALDSDPEDAALLAHRGLLHRRWHRWSEALNDLQRASELDPDNVDFLEAATVSATLAQDYQTASTLADPLLQAVDKPEHINSLWSAARTATLIPEASCIDESLLDKVRTSAAAEPRHSWRQAAVVGLLHRLGHLDEALKEMDRIEAAFPEYQDLGVGRASFCFRRGLILSEQGKPGEAKAAFRSGEAIGSSSTQPPGVFPKQGRHAFVDYLALHRELRLIIESDYDSEDSVATQPQH